MLRGSRIRLRGRGTRIIKRAIKREQGANQAKLPVLVNMLDAVRQKLDFRRPADLMMWAGLTRGFFFMMRASENLANEGGGFEEEKMVRWEDVTFYQRWKACDTLHRKGAAR